MGIHPETIVRWADGTEAEYGDVAAGEYNYMSDDYEFLPDDLETEPREVDETEKQPDPDCEGCSGGDAVPAAGYWRCPRCDTEWYDEDGDPQLVEYEPR